MRSYQHRYHAGNFADIHKQLVLIAVLEALQKKETPFCVVDAFAGEGVYDLNSKEASKNKEYLTGLEFLKLCRKTVIYFKNYQKLFRHINSMILKEIFILVLQLLLVNI